LLQRKLDSYFDGGIFGSPDDKEQILENERYNYNITGKGLFLGGSMYDYQAAKNEKLDCVFLSKWAEVNDWKGKFSIINTYMDLSDLVKECT
jgi:hypothetical protein